MGETSANPIDALVAEARRRLGEETGAGAAQLDNLERAFQELLGRHKTALEETAQQTEQAARRLLEELSERHKRAAEEIEQQIEQMSQKSLEELRERQKKLEETVGEQLDQLAKYEPPPPPPPIAPLDEVLSCVQNLITATLPEQVLEGLTEEVEKLGVRAAVFDVRGKAAWGLSARGFGSTLPDRTFHAVVVPLNQDNPFRQVVETGAPVDANVDLLKRNRNVLDKLKPGHEYSILLLPIRSGGSVSAIFYADSGGKETPIPADALKILTEFAGAQLDRLMALSGGFPAEVEEKEPAEQEHEEAPEARAPEPEAPRAVAAPPEAQEHAVEAAAEAHAAVSTAVEEVPPPAPEPLRVAPPAPAPAAFDLSQLSEEEQKYHKDAKRFAKLLVSEIDLYNKGKVADGRKNRDLYARLKSDIDRSRQTYQKRFSKPVSTPVDYFHEELVRLLANNDASLMGPGYSGPSV